MAQWRLALPCWARHNVGSDRRRTGRRPQTAAAPRLDLPSGAPVPCGAPQRVCVGGSAAQSNLLAPGACACGPCATVRCAGGRNGPQPRSHACSITELFQSTYPRQSPDPTQAALPSNRVMIVYCTDAPLAMRHARGLSMRPDSRALPCLVVDNLITPFDSRTTGQRTSLLVLHTYHARTGRRRHDG